MNNTYQEAIENSNIVSKTDINGIITFVNDEFCKISGYSYDELIGQNHNIVRHPDVPNSNFETLWETILAKKSFKATVKNLSKDKKTVYLNTTITPILDKDENKLYTFYDLLYSTCNTLNDANNNYDKLYSIIYASDNEEDIINTIINAQN